jgi:hypothetical protein
MQPQTPDHIWAAHIWSEKRQVMESIQTIGAWIYDQGFTRPRSNPSRPCRIDGQELISYLPVTRAVVRAWLTAAPRLRRAITRTRAQSPRKIGATRRGVNGERAKKVLTIDGTQRSPTDEGARPRRKPKLRRAIHHWLWCLHANWCHWRMRCIMVNTRFLSSVPEWRRARKAAATAQFPPVADPSSSNEGQGAARGVYIALRSEAVTPNGRHWRGFRGVPTIGAGYGEGSPRGRFGGLFQTELRSPRREDEIRWADPTLSAVQGNARTIRSRPTDGPTWQRARFGHWPGLTHTSERTKAWQREWQTGRACQSARAALPLEEMRGGGVLNGPVCGIRPTNRFGIFFFLYSISIQIQLRF